MILKFLLLLEQYLKMLIRPEVLSSLVLIALGFSNLRGIEKGRITYLTYKSRLMSSLMLFIVAIALIFYGFQYRDIFYGLKEIRI